jgi:hypothetical protein
MRKYKSSAIRKKLGRFIKVSPIYSTRSGESVRNQYEIKFEHGTIFQSYDSLIGIRTGGKLYLTDYHDCSTTTSKYCCEWCGYNGKERREGLKSGKFFLLDSTDM